MKTLNELPPFGEYDYLAPIIYLLYRKGIVNKEELLHCIASYKGGFRLNEFLKRIEECLEVPNA